MGGLTDRLIWWVYWLLIEWELRAIKWKVGIAIAVIWTADTLFFTGLISRILLAVLFGCIALIALIPSVLTAVGVADKLNLVNLTEEQSLIRRFFSLIFSDITEYIEVLLDYLFGD